jgi:hypothetical protein
LALVQIESTIDALSTKLASLQYATTLENLQPLTVISQEVALTLFQTILPLSTSLQACKSLDLEPLTLSNLPLALKTKIPILLHYDISVGTDTVLCISQTYSLKEEECMADIINKTRKLIPFREPNELRAYLLNNFVGTVAHLLISENEAVFTSSPFGNSACIGSYKPTSNEPTLDLRLLHEHFYEKLNSAYTSIFDYLDIMVSHLGDTIHSITAEDYNPPIPLMSKEESIASILALLPTYLPNLPSRIPVYSNFEEYFSATLENSPDYLIESISKELLETLPDRQRKILHSSLIQFHSGLSQRMVEYIKTFNLYQNEFYLPKTLLFHPDQNPSTFLVLIRSFLPNLDENLLTEIYIMLQNEKISMLQDVSFLFRKDTKAVHLTRSKFSEIARRQWKNYSSGGKINSTGTKEESKLNFLHNYHNLSEVTFEPADIYPSCPTLQKCM